MTNKTEKEMTAMFGFVPDFYGTLPETIRDHAWAIQRDLEFAQSALEPKVKELIGLALAAHIKCRYCTYFHQEAARLQGASDEELHEATAMGGFTALMSNSITGARYDLEKFQREVDRAVKHLQSSGVQPSAH